MPWDKRRRTPKIIQKYAFCIFYPDPCKATRSWVTKRVINNRKDLALFVAPTIIMFLYFPHPLTRRSVTASLKTTTGTPLLWRTSSAQISHSPLQPCTHSAFLASSKSSMRLLFVRISFSFAPSISQAEFKMSATTLGLRLIKNSARWILPSAFCSKASACSSVNVLLPLSAITSETS